jgi:hypothetical protein
MPEEVTLGELSRNIKGMEVRVNEKFSEVNHRLDSLQFVPSNVYLIEQEQMKQRLNVLEVRDIWRNRMMVGAFLFPLMIALVIALIQK